VARWFASVVSLTLLGVLVAGCSDPGEAYLETQSSIRSTLNSERMPVASVSCTPHTGDLAWTDPPAHLHCRVRFKNGTSYVTPATVQPVVDQPDALTWNGPSDSRGVIDITKAPLPVPTSSLSATSTSSLFEAANLGPVVVALNKRFRKQSIVQLAIYPGELQAVIINGDNQARLVTTDPQGSLRIGPPLGVNGSRLAIYPSQVTPAVVERLAGLISTRGGLPMSRLSRFVLAIHGSNAGWDIYPTSGRIRFEAPLQGESLSVITAHGKRKLS
jgi:hypothetical protein